MSDELEVKTEGETVQEVAESAPQEVVAEPVVESTPVVEEKTEDVGNPVAEGTV